MTTLGITGSLFFLAVSIALFCAWRKALHTVAVLRREVLEAQQKQKHDELRFNQRSQLDTIKDEFISTVSHELRTPLTSIRGALGLLSAGLMGSLDAKAHHLLRIAVTNTDRLIRLINDILDLERMESGRASLHLRRCSLSELVRQAVETMTAMADTAHVKLLVAPVESVPSAILLAATHPGAVTIPRFDRALLEERRPQNRSTDHAHPEDLVFDERRFEQRRANEERRRFDRRGTNGRVPVYFDGDSDRMLQVLTNLLSNAIKFSPPETTVTIHLAASPDFLHLRVSDQGRGIPQEKLEAVFDRFQQVEATDARQKGGTGLGLAICRTIIQQHGGTIWAERNPTVGVSLCVDVPRINRASDQMPAPDSSTQHENVVIVCDDDPGIRVVVAEHLRRQGYTVLETSSGEETLDLAAAQPIEAILLDLYMPGLSGWETLQRLKQNPATANIPVVILSVLSPSERPGLVGNAQGWVQKPFNDDLLIAELGRVLQHGDAPGRILLVEDDVDFANVILAGFHNANLHLDHATTLQQAMEQCLLAPPELIILDLTLPDGDGFSFVDWMRKHEDLRALPLIVYSGREVSEDERDDLRLGPTQFLTKATVEPLEVEELVLTMVHRLRKPAPEWS